LSNVDNYRQGLEAFNARDWDGVGEAYTANAQYVDRARDVTLKGQEEIVDYLRDGWVGAFSDAQCTRVSVLDAGDAVIGQFVGVGTNDGPLGPMPATGRRMQVPFCEVARFNPAGQIVASELYYDQLSILTQLGHVQEPAD
jgi:hypothetical protein